MSYLVLARKFRPMTFDEVVGQESATKTLKNSISKQRIPHALLFCGVRGIGKTTIARIYAKALNCIEGPTITPCSKCPNCLEISQGSSMDVLEIDGASNTSVNDVRELRETVRYLPSKSKYKIYIIDEVHMLSESAFNALLKTLEEPPDNVVFIFATTEPEDIPQTIISRCQRFDLKTIPDEKIFNTLKNIVEKEKFEISDYSLQIVAREGRGSMRDALSVLDKIIALGGEKIEDQEVIETLGLIKRELISYTAENIINKKTKELLKTIDELFSQGYDPKVFLSELLEYLRNILITKIDETGSMLKIPSEELEQIKNLSGNVSVDELELVFDIIKAATVEVSRTDFQRYVTELALIRASSITPLAKLDDVLQNLKKNAENTSKNISADIEQEKESKTQSSTIEPVMNNKKKLNSENVISEWSLIVDQLKQKKPYLGMTLKEVSVSFKEGSFKLAFPKDSFSMDMASDPENLGLIKSTLAQNYSNVESLDVVTLKQEKTKDVDTGKNPDQSVGSSSEKAAVKKVLNILGGRIEGNGLTK